VGVKRGFQDSRVQSSRAPAWGDLVPPMSFCHWLGPIKTQSPSRLSYSLALLLGTLRTLGTVCGSLMYSSLV
jgi:hypothetical protein